MESQPIHRTQEPSGRALRVSQSSYKASAPCVAFKRFLRDVFCGDEDLIRWVQKALGYSLTGLTTEQVFFIAYGTGANGKSTLFETILDVVGAYGRSADFDTFLASDRSNARTLEGVAKLQGIRFAVASETDSSRRFNEALVKKITGGDTITGSFLYGNAFEFRPEFKLWLLANHLPIAKDGSNGFWRRVRVIPFSRRFEAHERDNDLKDKLLREAEGIFAWMVEGARLWYREGLGTCDAVSKASNEYKEDNDTFSNFLSRYVEDAAGAETRASFLHQAYENWCDEVGEQPCTNVIFASRMLERGYKKNRKAAGIVYLNVKLKAPEGYVVADNGQLMTDF